MSTVGLGVNFSHRYAESLGLDADEAYYATLIHLRPRYLRLSLYWDEAVPEAGQYDPARVRWLVDQAQDRGCGVLLTLGFKPQRHPAYFPPTWLTSGTSEHINGRASGRVAANLLMMMERVVALFADYDAIDAWEVENLPYVSRRLQPSGWSIDGGLVRREIDVIHEVDARHRDVVVSHAGGNVFDLGWCRSLAEGDVLGFAPADTGPQNGLRPARAAISRAYAAWGLSLQGMLARLAGRRLWITELIVEPEASRVSAQPPAETLRLKANAAVRAGAERVYLRGVEDWFKARQDGHPDTWNAACEIMRAGESGRA